VLPDEKYNRAFGIKVKKAGEVFIIIFFLYLLFFFFIVLPDENYDRAFWN
jgi:hypothetical protein